MPTATVPAVRPEPDFLAATAMLATSGLWAFNWIVVKTIAHEIAPFVLAAVRVGLGAAFLFVVLIALRKPLRSPPFWPTFVCGMLQMGAFVLLQNVALLTGAVGKTAILTYTMPLWAVLLAVPLLGERITPLRLLALAVGLGGLAFVLFPFDLGTALLPNLLALGNAVLWGLGMVLTKRWRKGMQVDTMTFTAWQLAYSVPPLTVAALLVPGAYIIPTPTLFYAIAYVAIGSTTVAFLMWMLFLARVSAGTAGIASLLTPVLSFGMAAVLLGERPAPAETIGIVLIVAGLAINSLPQPTAAAAAP